MQLKILPQDWLDGACLLYAMVNAGKSLLAPNLGLFTYVRRYRMFRPTAHRSNCG
ncbi:MAG: hypothetical protein H7839_23500 [Magnetococcus sp. YQC-5]